MNEISKYRQSEEAAWNLLEAERQATKRLREQVAAQAAVIEKLLYHVHEAEVYTVYTKYDKALVEIRAVLAIPTDSTQVLAEVRRAERERCAKVCSGNLIDQITYAEHAAIKKCAAAIRAME